MGVRARAVKLLVAAMACLTASSVCCGSALASIKFLTSFGSFSNVQGVAVNSSTGDVYVYDAGAETISRFDAEGNPVSFSSTGTNTIVGVGGTAFGGEAELAVDSSSDPAKGDIYLARGGSAPVSIYSAAGAHVGELTAAAGAPWGEACGVAVDTSGAVYVGIYREWVNKYVPKADPAQNSDYTSSITGTNETCNVAVDSAGSVFSAAYAGGITRYEASLFGGSSASGSLVDSAGHTVAVDPSSDEVYVDEEYQVAQFGPNGKPEQAPVATFGSSGSGAISGSFGIAYSDFSHALYVSDGHGHISVFSTLTLPEAVTGSASNVQTTSATLNGTVNPEGVALTSCRFEYGTTSAYGQSAPCAEDPGTATSPVSVHADVSALAPGARYHFRLIAANANGAAEGADQAFATPGAPRIFAEKAQRVDQTAASFTAEIDPSNLPTTYHVEYGTSEAYGQSTPESQPVGQDAALHNATVRVEGLQPGTTYHFRFVATNSIEAVAGQDAVFTTRQAQAGQCSNEAARTNLSARMPDCRAYEQVSPIDKEGSAIRSLVGEEGLRFVAARDGQQMFYLANDALRGTDAGGETLYLATRTGSEWLTSPLSPPNLLEIPKNVLGTPTGWYTWLSEDLTCKTLVSTQPLTSDTPAADISDKDANLYRLNADGSYTLLSNRAPLETYFAEFQVFGASSDCKKIFFSSRYQLLPEAPRDGQSLYEWDEGELRLASLIPGPAPQGVELDGKTGTASPNKSRVSPDGARVVFVTPPSASGDVGGQIYVREGNDTSGARTLDASAPQTSASSEGAVLQGQSRDESRVFFVANYGLASNASSSGPARCGYQSSDDQSHGLGCDLYEYNVEDEQLTDLSADENSADATGADVAGVFDLSEDGSYVYFAALGQLTPSSGDPEENTEATNEARNELNVYLAHAGRLQFVARVTQLDAFKLAPIAKNGDVIGDADHWGSRTTPDGGELLFISRVSLTGYDNTDVMTGEPDPEVYLFSTDTGKTVCVSCNPEGERPYPKLDALTHTPVESQRIAIANRRVPIGAPRVLSEDGDRVFFESPDQLSPLVAAGQMNVYEWERAGKGSCAQESATYSQASGGCLYLLDSGVPQSSVGQPAMLLDASASGDDVFLRTATKLLPQDSDNVEDIYDVRVGGGLAEAGAGGVGCEGEACQGLAPGTPTFGTPSSASFAGAESHPRAGSPAKKARRLTRAQKRARALRRCARKKGRHRRELCVRRLKRRSEAGRSHKATVTRGGK